VAKLRVKWVKSAVGYAKDQKRTIKALGLKKMGQSIEVNDSPAMHGMILKVRHLVNLEEVSQ